MGSRKRGGPVMTTAELHDSVNSLSPEERATATVQLARLLERQSNILGEPVPERVLRVLRGETTTPPPALTRSDSAARPTVAQTQR
jgi:hypothetical protein